MVAKIIVQTSLCIIAGQEVRRGRVSGLGRRHKVKLPDKQTITSVKSLSTDSHHMGCERAAE